MGSASAKSSVVAASTVRSASFTLMPVLSGNSSLVLVDGEPSYRLLTGGVPQKFSFAASPDHSVSISATQFLSYLAHSVSPLACTKLVNSFFV